MKAIEEMLAKKRDEQKKLQIEIATLEELLKRASGEQIPARKRAVRSDVKKSVLGLLEEVGSAGLNAGVAISLAEKRGFHLERGTVSSLLSRLKSDKVVRYDGDVYRLAKFGVDGEAGPDGKVEASIHPFPASKSAS